MKTEPTTFSIDDLAAAPNQTTAWEGVRNYQARNMMRDEMKIGDGVLFYHSNCPEPAIMGLAKVCKLAYPDPTQFDSSSIYYDPKATPEKPIWWLVDIQFQKKFICPITLQDMKNIPALSELIILRRGNRLSITPIQKNEWEHIIKTCPTSR